MHEKLTAISVMAIAMCSTEVDDRDPPETPVHVDQPGSADETVRGGFERWEGVRRDDDGCYWHYERKLGCAYEGSSSPENHRSREEHEPELRFDKYGCRWRGGTFYGCPTPPQKSGSTLMTPDGPTHTEGIWGALTGPPGTGKSGSTEDSSEHK